MPCIYSSFVVLLVVLVAMLNIYVVYNVVVVVVVQIELVVVVLLAYAHAPCTGSTIYNSTCQLTVSKSRDNCDDSITG